MRRVRCEQLLARLATYRRVWRADDGVANGDLGRALQDPDHSRKIVLFAVLWSEPWYEETLLAIIAVPGKEELGTNE